MKPILFTILILLGVISTFAQVPTRVYEKGEAFEKHPKFKISQNNSPEKKMPVFDLAPLLAEDEAMKGLDVPFRFGKSFEVNLELKDGKWIKTDSTEVWNIKITSPNAYSLNFIFTKLYLPEGAELYIFNDDGTMVYGPVTEKQNQHGKSYLTDIIQGKSAIIQLSIPITSKEKPELIIQRVVHGYRNIFSNLDIGYGESGPCNEDVACYFPAWQDEADGVVQILLSNGNELCSGSLLNNTAQDYRPFILTAFHCIDIGNPNIDGDPDENGILEQYEIDEAEEWLVRFRFRHTTCGGSTIANGVTYDDTHFRAAWNTTDFALVELEDNIINDTYSVGQKVWLGWDRTGNTPTNGTYIHHPSGDVMKYAYNNDALPETARGSTSSGQNFWYTKIDVGTSDKGTLENGSSGSPVFDQNSRVVGQLNSGFPGCNSTKEFWHGCLFRSWTGDSTDTGRLSNWLQPTGTATTLNSDRQPTPKYSGIENDLCSNSNFSVTNLAPGYSIHHWNGNNVTFPNGNTSSPVLVSPNTTSGQGWVEAVINTGAGQYTMARRNFWIGMPLLPEINSYSPYIWTTAYGEPAAKEYTIYTEQDIVFYDENTNLYGGLVGNFDWTWYLDDGGIYHDEYDYGDEGKMYIFHQPGTVRLRTSVESVGDGCGSTDLSAPVYVVVIEQEYLLSLSPNPASGETTIKIESTKKDKVYKEIEWELEVFDQTQALKAKTNKLTVNTTKIQTSNWKDGVYIVRAKIGDKILTEKLIVKH